MLANVLKYRERRCGSVREDEENREVPNRPVIFHSLFDGNICQCQDCGSPHVCNEQTKNLILPWNWNYEHNVAHGTSRCWSQVVRGTLTIEKPYFGSPVMGSAASLAANENAISSFSSAHAACDRLTDIDWSRELGRTLGLSAPVCDRSNFGSITYKLKLGEQHTRRGHVAGHTRMLRLPMSGTMNALIIFSAPNGTSLSLVESTTH